MKNLFLKSTALSAVLFLCANVFAQSSLEVRDPANNNAVVTGTTMYFTIAAGTTHTIDFDAYNVSSSAHTYLIEKQELVFTAGDMAWFCVYHNGDAADPQSHCYGTQTTTTPDNFATSAGDFNRLQCDFSTTDTGVSIVRYRVFDQNNPADSVSFTLVYNATPAGIPAYENFSAVGMAYPNPSAGIFTFDAFSSGLYTVQVCSVNGALISAEASVAGSGKIHIDLSGLPEGVYFCRFISASGIATDRRLVLTR